MGVHGECQMRTLGICSARRRLATSACLMTPIPRDRYRKALVGVYVGVNEENESVQ